MDWSWSWWSFGVGVALGTLAGCVAMWAVALLGAGAAQSEREQPAADERERWR